MGKPPNKTTKYKRFMLVNLIQIIHKAEHELRFFPSTHEAAGVRKWPQTNIFQIHIFLDTQIHIYFPNT